MNNQDEVCECYIRLRNGISKLTQKPFPKCLYYIDQVDNIYASLTSNPEYICKDCGEGEIHSHCACRVRIKHINIFINKRTNTKFIIGNICVNSLVKDLKKYEDNSIEFKDLYSKWNAIRCNINNKNRKCQHCEKPWTYKNCFHAGLCKECKVLEKEILNTKIILPKYKNWKLKTMKDDIEYMKLCIEWKTRQADLFKSYIEFYSSA
jgi:hypothetical protein